MVQSSNYELCSYRQRQIKNLIRNTQYHYQLKDKKITFDGKVDFRFSAFFDALTVIVICKIKDWKILNWRHNKFHIHCRDQRDSRKSLGLDNFCLVSPGLGLDNPQNAKSRGVSVSTT